jgi:hypothetical protein
MSNEKTLTEQQTIFGCRWRLDRDRAAKSRILYRNLSQGVDARLGPA